MSFSTEADVEWGLNDERTSSREALEAALLAIPHTGGDTNTPAALELARTMVFNSPGDRCVNTEVTHYR